MGSERKFQVGDVVVANGGGPHMTVQKATYPGIGESYIQCRWFYEGELRSGAFDPREIRLFMPEVFHDDV